MRLKLDTHLLIWAGDFLAPELEASPLSAEAIDLLADRGNELIFRAVGVREVGIKNARHRPGFRSDPNAFPRGLIDVGHSELPVNSRHAAAVGSLPDIDKDPCDRLLIAEAIVEGVTLRTADKTIAGYPGPVRLV